MVVSSISQMHMQFGKNSKLTIVAVMVRESLLWKSLSVLFPKVQSHLLNILMTLKACGMNTLVIDRFRVATVELLRLALVQF